MEAEVRAILRDVLTRPPVPIALGTRVHQRFAAIGGIDVEQPSTRRATPRRRLVLVIVLDTNVVSELMRAEAAPAVVAWIDRRPAGDIWLTAVTLAELLYGIGRLPDDRRKTNFADQFETMISDDFDHRVLPFDETAAAHYADVVVARERAGQPISAADAQIAAICRSHNALLATRNIKDFKDTRTTTANPWTDH